MAKRRSVHQIVLILFSTHRSPLRPSTRHLQDSDLSALATWPASIPSAILPVLHKGLRSAEIIAEWLFFARPRVQPEVVETARFVSAAISPDGFSGLYASWTSTSQPRRRSRCALRTRATSVQTRMA